MTNHPNFCQSGIGTLTIKFPSSTRLQINGTEPWFIRDDGLSHNKIFPAYEQYYPQFLYEAEPFKINSNVWV